MSEISDERDDWWSQPIDPEWVRQVMAEVGGRMREESFDPGAVLDILCVVNGPVCRRWAFNMHYRGNTAERIRSTLAKDDWIITDGGWLCPTKHERLSA